MLLRVLTVIALLLSWASCQDKGNDAVTLKRGMFSRELGMLDAERDEYATHLAAQAANRIVANENDSCARRMLSLAKKLSPRNRRAASVDAAVRQGGKPKPVDDAFTPVAMAQLLATRAGLLLAEDGTENRWVGRAFMELAAELNPQNNHATSKRRELEEESGALDWGAPSRRD